MFKMIVKNCQSGYPDVHATVVSFFAERPKISLFGFFPNRLQIKKHYANLISICLNQILNHVNLI